MSIPVIAHAEAGHPLLVKEIDAALTRSGITEQKGERETVSSEPISHPGSWRYNPDAGCRYVQAMVAGWANDTPYERNPWMYNKMHKIAAACRLGCIDEPTRDDAKEALGKRMRELLLREPKRPLKKLELEGAWLRAVDKIARKTDDQVRAELAKKGELHIHLDSSCGNGQKQPTGSQPKASSAQPISIDGAHAIFRKWLGQSCDTDALDIMLAAAVMQSDEGDPVWLMLISGSGNAKTEMAQSLSGMGAEVTSAISSAGALLSATSKREKAANATGGLLRKLEKDGVGLLVVKDFTTLLSMNHNVRAEVLAALREVHDGRYQRNVGTDGGRTLTWEGRLVVIGACTTAWDRAHAVISVMGNRFVLVRVDSEDDANREEFGLQSIANLGSETKMRRELADTVAAVIASATEPPKITGPESLVLVRAANLATKARTAVEVDYQGNVEDSHAPEVPTRFAKQLAQIVRGAVALGIDRQQAMKLAVRCGRDSLPPIRHAILDDLAKEYAISTAGEVAKRIDKPRRSVDRQLQALHALGLATVKPASSPWDYVLKAGVDPKVLDPESCAEMLVDAHRDTEKERGKQ